MRHGRRRHASCFCPGVMKKPTALLCLILPVVLAGGVARAQPASAPPPGAVPAPPPAGAETVTRSYGLQILAVDAAVVAGSIAAESGEVLVGGYLLGGPLVHAANGNGGRVLASVGLRIALPLGGGLVGAAIGESRCARSEDPEFLCGLGEVAGGLLVGMAAATIVDSAVLARKQVEVPGAAPPAGLVRVGGVSATPDLGVGPQGAVSLGLSGTF